MSEKISRKAFQASLNRRLSGLQADPALAHRILAMEEKETKMAKKTAASLVIAIILLGVLGTGALAAILNAWGIIDFAGGKTNTYVPPQYEDSIYQEGLRIETGHVICTIRESYYDGKILRVTAHIAPKEKTLFISGDMSPADPVENHFPNPENERVSMAEYARNYYDGRMADILLDAAGDATHGLFYHDDGTCTLYLECIFDEEIPRRDVELHLKYTPLLIMEGELGTYDSSAREVTAIPMTFQAVHVKTYACLDSIDFPDVGVKMTQVTMIVTPLEIRYTLDYEITDLDAYHAQNGGLWFEFIRADSRETAYSAQRVSSGLSNVGSVGRKDGLHHMPDEIGTVYRQMDAIGLDAIGESYTIRAYNAWDKTRYETRTIKVTEMPEPPI